MRTRICRMCGKPFEAEKTEAVYCPDCSPKARAATVIRPRTCIDCGTAFPGGPRARRCPECRQAAQREAERRHRQNGTSRPLGSVDQCARCGASYVVNGSRQRYCPDCAAPALRENIAPVKQAYNKAHAEYLDKIARAKKSGIKLCVVCGAPICSDRSTNTCSPECRLARMRERRAKNKKEKPT